MLRHGRAGIPMEVVGLMLGEFIDDYTIKVVDVFSMPQRGNTVSIEDIDPVYQTTMLEYLKQTGRPESVVGWYHSHPGFGCWFSGTDMNTQQSFEQLNPRAVGVVVDPIQSVKGKVVMDCFRLVSPTVGMSGGPSRQVTTNIGHSSGVKPSITALVHGLNRHYYSINVNHKTKSAIEQTMLLSLDKGKWQQSLKTPSSFQHRKKENLEIVKDLVQHTNLYNEQINDSMTMTENEILVKSAGKIDAKRHIADNAETIINQNLLQTLATNTHTLLLA
jgi:26S proteasome regulatory subunit N11